MIVPTGFVRTFSLFCFWVLPLVVPAAFVIRHLMDTPAVDSPVGWACLALPATMVSVERPLRGWESLQPRVISASPVHPVATLPDPDPILHVDTAIPIELHGHVGHGESVVYFFLDTENNKWFRLSPGEVDPDRKLALQSGDGEALRMVNLSTGSQYMISPGQRSPVLVTEER
ncbi:hypothetical protein G0Q06_09655 [Puniceicoccales bacterium CK1056]|uniref:Uncharacterized protein n=1 Tax=Oceanipulchritudo coccoides TaxID=2706888 RepID=A0A6B2M3N4_9BACT|nr:hypothetical protein [Oceanipulchritudo coccoides]NDV62714.1 hypothetical protein [Oceanipulchritudo coccoides]